MEMGMWNDDVKNKIIADKGSIQGVEGIPPHIKELFKTVYEIRQKDIIDMAADRGPFIDQSQSLNLHMEKAKYAKVSSALFYAHAKGMKTGCYYLRTKGAAAPIQFTVDRTKLKRKCDEDCMMCSA